LIPLIQFSNNRHWLAEAKCYDCELIPLTRQRSPFLSVSLLLSSSSYQLHHGSLRTSSSVSRRGTLSPYPAVSFVRLPLIDTADNYSRFEPYSDNGGTILAIAGNDFSVVAGDTRQSEGYSIQTRYARKVFQLSVIMLSTYTPADLPEPTMQFWRLTDLRLMATILSSESSRG
jgi:hypothetical protein